MVGTAGAFGSFEAGSTRSEEFRGWALTVRAAAGYQLPLDAGSRLQLCPTADVSLVFGPDSLWGSDVSYRESSLALGVSLGLAAVQMGRVSLAAAAGLAAVRASSRFDNRVGGFEVLRSTSGFANLGLGLILGDALMLRPSVSIPIGQDKYPAPIGIRDGSTRYALTVGVAFGPRRIGPPGR